MEVGHEAFLAQREVCSGVTRGRMSPKPLPRKLTVKEVSRDILGESIKQLRKQLSALFAQDQAIFKQFHEIERTISELKSQEDEDPESSEEDEDPPSSRAKQETTVCPKVSKPLLAIEGRFIRRDSFGTFHKHVVTFPPSRARCPRLSVVRNREPSPRRPLASDIARRMSCVDLSVDLSNNVICQLPPLYRSTSVTVLPRGILVRRAGSCDSGFGGSPSDGEVFV